MPFVYPDTSHMFFRPLDGSSWSSFLNGTIFDGLFYLEFGGSIREVRTTPSLRLAGGSRIATARECFRTVDTLVKC